MRRGGCLELYYCNMVEWSWWDLSPCLLWHCWFGHMTCKIVPEMTYNVLSGTLNLYTASLLPPGLWRVYLHADWLEIRMISSQMVVSDTDYPLHLSANRNMLVVYSPLWLWRIILQWWALFETRDWYPYFTYKYSFNCCTHYRYITDSTNLVCWPLMGGLLRLVGWWEDCARCPLVVVSKVVRFCWHLCDC